MSTSRLVSSSSSSSSSSWTEGGLLLSSSSSMREQSDQQRRRDAKERLLFQCSIAPSGDLGCAPLRSTANAGIVAQTTDPIHTLTCHDTEDNDDFIGHGLVTDNDEDVVMDSDAEDNLDVYPDISLPRPELYHNLDQEDDEDDMSMGGLESFNDTTQNLPPTTDSSHNSQNPPPPPDPSHNSDRVYHHGIDIDIDVLAETARLEDIQIAIQFIQALKNATLNDEANKLDKDMLHRLQDPPQASLDIDDPDVLLSIETFMALSNSSQETYHLIRKAILHRYPDSKMLSYDQVKRRITKMSGVGSIVHDMCVTSCLAYTGPFASLEICPKCGEPRYDQSKLASSGGKEKVPRQQFHTIPVGPQLQALWRHSDTATSMHYRERQTADIMEELKLDNNILSSYDDFFHRKDYLDAVSDGRINAHDSVLMISVDGAQLYESKASDCWIYIWVVMDHTPNVHYKKKHVLPGGFIPGSNKPKNLDSFMFPGLHHVAALQKEGLVIWDALTNSLHVSHPFLAIANSDGPGLMYFNGFAGYHGKIGCRQLCGQKGRHKAGGPHYYPALLKPHNYSVEGCNHDDIDYRQVLPPTPGLYYQNLCFLIASPNVTQYKKRLLETGNLKNLKT
ncbi:hypothetical protein SERLA73DRAFT_75722 [Serpula lacrymans var. lacrymans S7.3]|uniref:Uncharacterized protein n=1 Tax=Serpula lacrymans var. lacrymans (strain S7.3) TaxID=936435 RepID=F8Q419_SERL3|nr:hypothetical protein SERLA73DRAFT_75722 [Serpula lacrymans var. lacrymans S7.3]